MKKPWDTWVLKGLSINEAAPLFEKMERIQMEPWGHSFGWKHLTLADGRRARLRIQKKGVVPVYMLEVEDKDRLTAVYVFESGLVCDDVWAVPAFGLPLYWQFLDTPLDIYLTDALKSHISSAPNTVVSSGPMQGQLGQYGTKLKSLDSPSAASPYESQVYPVNLEEPLFPDLYNTVELVNLRPEWESGIAVAFLQGLMGSGRATYVTPSLTGEELAHAEFVDRWRRKGYNYLKEGRAVIRSEGGSFFFVEELIAYRMTAPSLFMEILWQITHGQVAASVAKILYPMALAYLEPDLTTPYPLLEDGELDRFNIRSEFFVPPRFADWYWQWSPQLVANDPAEAYDVKVCRTSPEDNTAVIRKAYLLVAWNGDNPVPTTLTLTDYPIISLDVSKVDFFHTRLNPGGAGDSYAYSSGIPSTSIEWVTQADVPGGLAQVPTPNELIDPIPNFNRTPLAVYYSKKGEPVEIALTLSGEWDNHIEKQDETNPVYYQIPGPASARYYRRYSLQTYMVHIGPIDIKQDSGVLTEENIYSVSWVLPERNMCMSPQDLIDAGISWDKIWLIYHLGSFTQTVNRTTGKTQSNLLHIVIGEPGCVWVQENIRTYQTLTNYQTFSGRLGVYDWWYPPGGPQCASATLATKTITADYWYQYGIEVVKKTIESVKLFIDATEYVVNNSADAGFLNIGGDYLVARQSLNGSVIFNNVGFLVTDANAVWSSSTDIVHPTDFRQLRTWIGGA